MSRPELAFVTSTAATESIQRWNDGILTQQLPWHCPQTPDMHWLEEYPTTLGLSECVGVVGFGWLQLSFFLASTEAEMRQERHGKKMEKMKRLRESGNHKLGKGWAGAREKCSERKKEGKSHSKRSTTVTPVIQTEAV